MRNKPGKKGPGSHGPAATITALLKRAAKNCLTVAGIGFLLCSLGGDAASAAAVLRLALYPAAALLVLAPVHRIATGKAKAQKKARQARHAGRTRKTYAKRNLEKAPWNGAPAVAPQEQPAGNPDLTPIEDIPIADLL